MKDTFVIRVTGEICFFFSILNIFLVYRGWWLPMALFTAACFALGFLIVRCKNKMLRLLLSLLPGLCFLMVPLQPLLLFPCFAWLYYILVMTQGSFVIPLEEYRKVFRFMLLISLFFVACSIANSTIYRGVMISVPSLVYVFVFMFLGLFAMRRMQMGAEMSRKWQLSNAASTAGIPLLAVGASVLLFLLFRFVTPLVRILLRPIGKFAIWLANLLFPDQPMADPVEPTPTPTVHTSTLPSGSPFGSGSRLHDADSISTSPLMIDKAASIGAYVLMVLLLLVALYLVLQYVKRNRPVSAEEDLFYEEGERVSPEGKKTRGKGQRMVGHARQLRRIYQTYLEYINTKGLRIADSDTSQEILEQAQKVKTSPEAERLRELYIAARYGDPREVTREQVQEAQSCLERIVESGKS